MSMRAVDTLHIGEGTIHMMHTLANAAVTICTQYLHYTLIYTMALSTRTSGYRQHMYIAVIYSMLQVYTMYIQAITTRQMIPKHALFTRLQWLKQTYTVHTRLRRRTSIYTISTATATTIETDIHSFYKLWRLMQLYTICTATTNDAVPIYSIYMLRRLMHMYNMYSATDECRATLATWSSTNDETDYVQLYTMCTEYVQYDTMSCEALLQVLACTSHFERSLIP
jgi:hypothetical protein